MLPAGAAVFDRNPKAPPSENAWMPNQINAMISKKIIINWMKSAIRNFLENPSISNALKADFYYR